MKAMAITDHAATFEAVCESYTEGLYHPPRIGKETERGRVPEGRSR